MSPSPSESEAIAKLARLVAKGQHRIIEASAAHQQAQQADDKRLQRERDKCLREALGGLFSPIRVAVLVVSMVFLAVLAVGGDWNEALVLLILLSMWNAILFILPISGRAGRWRVRAEKAWIDSLPFPVHGYFELLACQPEPTCMLRIEFIWKEPRLVPKPEAVRSLFGLFDTGANAHAEGASVVVWSSPISGRTGWSVNDIVVYTNKRIVKYVHALVDKALLPLHRCHPIELVSIHRDD